MDLRPSASGREPSSIRLRRRRQRRMWRESSLACELRADAVRVAQAPGVARAGGPVAAMSPCPVVARLGTSGRNAGTSRLREVGSRRCPAPADPRGHSGALQASPPPERVPETGNPEAAQVQKSRGPQRVGPPATGAAPFSRAHHAGNRARMGAGVVIGPRHARAEQTPGFLAGRPNRRARNPAQRRRIDVPPRLPRRSGAGTGTIRPPGPSRSPGSNLPGGSTCWSGRRPRSGSWP